MLTRCDRDWSQASNNEVSPDWRLAAGTASQMYHNAWNTCTFRDCPQKKTKFEDHQRKRWSRSWVGPIPSWLKKTADIAVNEAFSGHHIFTLSTDLSYKVLIVVIHGQLSKPGTYAAEVKKALKSLMTLTRGPHSGLSLQRQRSSRDLNHNPGYQHSNTTNSWTKSSPRIVGQTFHAHTQDLAIHSIDNQTTAKPVTRKIYIIPQVIRVVEELGEHRD